jgi:arginine N-succinyltransferase
MMLLILDALGRGDPILLRAATERFSQGLDQYCQSALPRVLAGLEERIPAGMVDLQVPLDHHDYGVKSCSLWRSGLAAMVAGSYQDAYKYFRESMKRFEIGQMDADALWSWFDAILALLMLNQLSNAEQLYFEYADRATTSQPDFETASQEVIKAYRDREPASVLRAQELMAHKWTGFKDSEYPAIFRAFELKIIELTEPKSSLVILTPGAVSERRHRVLVCRPAAEADVGRLVEIAQEVNLGNTRPDAKSILEQIAICKNTLTGNISWEQGILYLATEITSDDGSREVVGSCKLQKMVEGCWARLTHQRVAKIVSEGRRRAAYDQLAYDSSKTNALEFSGTAVLQAYRNQGIGTFHAQARILFLLTHAIPGVRYLSADLLTDSIDNTFPFYETIVRPLIGRDIDYDRADALRYYDIQFFEALLGEVGDSDPPVKIPLHVLPPEIRRSLGKVRDQTIPAKRVLKKYGFRETQKFDLLDGGQYMEVQLDELRRSNFDQELTAKRSSHSVTATDPSVAFAPAGRPPSEFFAVRAQAKIHEREILIPTQLYRELEIQRNEIVRVVS